MKNLLLFILLLPALCYGQGDQTIINVPINAGGTTFQAILHLPNDYATTTTTYPLMVFFHGLGEGGASPASIYTSSTAGGPAYFIAQGTFPSSFVNPKDGKSYKYIVVSPQANPEGVQGSTTAQEADYILTYLYAHYRVDTTRVCLTGLSDGGETCDEYMGGIMSNGGNFLSFHKTHHIASIIPMSENGFANFLPAQADTIVANGIGAWGFGSTDEQGQNTLQLAWYCNQIKAGWMTTTSYVGGHCCWGQFYDPTFTQNGMSIYQWALQYTSVGSTAPAATVPVANGGAPQIIQLPTNQTMLNGDGSTVTNGTITKYAWTQQSGPSKAVITDSTSATTPVTGLTAAGVHVFALQITDNTGKTSTATTQVTVDAPPVVAGSSIPGKIEAESYSSMSGVATQGTSDSLGGLDVGWIDMGDWMDYTVNVATAGNYTVNFRVAAASAGATIQVKSASGTVLATVPIPATGGFQTWATISTVISLPAGSQTLQLYSASAINWNINWMQFASGGSIPQAIPGKIEAESYSSMSGVATQGTSDSLGGLDVGWIDLGDWMDYSVNAATAGNYTVNFRVAAASAGATIQVKSASGTVLATVPIPATGGFQTWTTISTVISLPAGSQILQIYSASAMNWNINWMQFISGGSAPQAIPGKVEAESYSSMSGVATQGTSDSLGGLDVGWIDLGDWMDYTVNVSTAGNYMANFRVAAPSAGATFQLKSANGTVLATVPIPATGGFQNWITVSAVVNLTAGNQTLQIYSSSALGWNFNWMQFVKDTAATQSLASDQSYVLDTTKGTDSSSVIVYPNPVKSSFTVGINNSHTGNMVIQIIDVTGKVHHVLASYKDQPSVLVNMTAADLTPGMYFIRVQIGKWSTVKKLLKQ